MKISYEFVTGKISEVEVDERLGEMLLDLDRQQYNNDQKENCRHVSLDCMDYEGELFVSAEDTEREAERWELQTETLTIKVRPLASGYVKAKTGNKTSAETYASGTNPYICRNQRQWTQRQKERDEGG